MELNVSGPGTAELSPVRKTYSGGSMLTVILSPEAGFYALIRRNGTPAEATRTFSFAVREDTLLEVEFLAQPSSPAREVRFPEGFRGEWTSADGTYGLSVGERSLSLTRSGTVVPAEISCEYDPAYGGSEFFFVSAMGKRYELSFFGNQTALALRCGEETIVFVPAELPEFLFSKSLYGQYTLEPGSPSYSSEELSVTEEGMFWGRERVVLLGEPNVNGETPALVLVGNRVLSLFLCKRDVLFEYTIVLRDPLTGEEFHYA